MNHNNILSYQHHCYHHNYCDDDDDDDGDNYDDGTTTNTRIQLKENILCYPLQRRIDFQNKLYAKLWLIYIGIKPLL